MMPCFVLIVIVFIVEEGKLWVLEEGKLWLLEDVIRWVLEDVARRPPSYYGLRCSYS